MQIAHINHANAMPGLFTMGTEFVAETAETLRVFHNRSEIGFEELPENIYRIIRKTMGKSDATMAEMKAFCIKLWGGIDGDADIDENGNVGKPEYVPGISPAHYPCGKPISNGHMRVIRNITEDKTKEIADKVFISEKTVNNHLQAIYQLSGCKNKAQVAVLAAKGGLI